MINKYLTKLDGTYFKRDFSMLCGDSYESILRWQIPFVILGYYLYGKRRLKKHQELYKKHIAGTSIKDGNEIAQKLGFIA